MVGVGAVVGVGVEVGVVVVVVVEVEVGVEVVVRELIIITNLGRIFREYPDRWQYENKDLSKIMRPTELVVTVLMSETDNPTDSRNSFR